MNKNHVCFDETYKKELYNIPVEYCLEGRKKFADGGIVIVVNLIKDQTKKSFFVVYFKDDMKKDIYSNPELVCDVKGTMLRRNVKRYISECLELFNPNTLTFDEAKAKELLAKYNAKQDNEEEK